MRLLIVDDHEVVRRGVRALRVREEGREVLAVFRDPSDATPYYFVELGFVDGKIATIRDFRYVSYIASEATIVLSR